MSAVNCIEKKKIKKKESGNGPFLKRIGNSDLVLKIPDGDRHDWHGLVGCEAGTIQPRWSPIGGPPN